MFISLTTHLFLTLKRFIVLLLVGSETVLAQNQLSQVEWETVGIFQCEYIYTRNLFAFSLFHEFIEQTDTFIQSAEEAILLALDYRSDLSLLFHELWICLTHICDELWYKFVHECLALTEESVTIAYSTTQDTTNHITRLLVTWQLTISNSESYSTDMISYHTHCHIHFLLFAILYATEFANLLQHWLEHVGIIIRLFPLHGTHQTLEAHTGINHLIWQTV